VDVIINLIFESKTFLKPFYYYYLMVTNDGSLGSESQGSYSRGNGNSFRNFGYAALTAAGICGIYHLAKNMLNLDIPTNPNFSIDGIVTYAGLVSGVLGGLSLLRGKDRRRNQEVGDIVRFEEIKRIPR
jgi:hypothetical protein